MRVLIDVGHPAHVHFYRGAIALLQERGHRVRVTARAKDVTLELLDGFGISYRLLSRAARHRAGLYAEWPVRTARLALAARAFRADVVTAIGGAFAAPAGKLAGVPSLIFTDTEHVRIDRLLTFPLATRICVPYTFGADVGREVTRYHGLHELAYLSPARFAADPEVLAAAGLAPPFAVVRFVSWSASHDRGHSGLARLGREEVLRRLGSRCDVVVSDERSARLARGDGTPLSIPPHAVHHVLAQARLYLGEGATMATEAGLLGTPSIYVSSLVGTMGNFEALREAGLVESFVDPAAALARAEALLDGDEGAEWAERARRFAARHVDVDSFVAEQIEEVGAGKKPGASRQES